MNDNYLMDQIVLNFDGTKKLKDYLDKENYAKCFGTPGIPSNLKGGHFYESPMFYRKDSFGNDIKKNGKHKIVFDETNKKTLINEINSEEEDEENQQKKKKKKKRCCSIF